MSLVQFYIASEVARDCISVLGDMGCVQFRDMNRSVNTFQRAFVNEIRKFDATERQLRFLRDEIERQGITISEAAYDTLVQEPNLNNRAQNLPSASHMDDVIKVIETYESNVRHMTESYDELLTSKFDMEQHRTVLRGTRSFFDSRLSVELENNERFSSDSALRLNRRASSVDEFMVSDDEDTGILLESGVGATDRRPQEPLSTGINELNILGSTMNFIAGTVDMDKFLILEKICWRALRGNLYINHIPLEEPVFESGSDEKPKFKCIFLIFTHGEALINKCKKIVDSLDGKLYTVDSDYDVYKQELVSINSKLEDLSHVLDHTKERLTIELKEVALELERYTIDIRKEKSIYSVLNLLNYDETRRCLIGEGWVPDSDLPYVKVALREITEQVDRDLNTIVNIVQTNKVPPTFHRTNKFTAAYQSIIDAYGIATYQEVNPGLATIVTFPFMFAIMFGDLGHGFLLFLAALALVIYENRIGKMKNRDEIFDMAYTGRYILLLMGVFSMYTGLMYNDLFSKSMTMFKSGWAWPTDFKEGEAVTATSVGVYPFGIDPAWHGTENNLLFTNSYKMKLSILMGFVHMSYSFYFSLVNYRFFKSRVDIVGNFIPGLLFMQSIFGYLTLTIVYKWCVDWVAIGKPAPGLLNMLINMFLSPGKVDEELYPGQGFVQVVLVLIALVCVPWLLLYKPLVLKRQNDNRSGVTLGYTDLETTNDSRYSIETVTDDVTEEGTLFHSPQEPLHEDDEINELLKNLHEEDEPEAFEFGDVMVHQVIHTIEFCLNCVSHTASYLRLWALSLAHNQLSAVLWEMTIQNSFVPFNEGGFAASVVVFLLFGMWFVLTVCILVVMEGTSAMLHSLRLHWVEAMSKFFEGEGYAYEPFSFYSVIKEAESSERS